MNLTYSADFGRSWLVYFSTDETLTDFMSKRGDEFDGETDLDFLFKVLSIHYSLSLQIHPDKTCARLLHAKNPEVYRTPKHKQEMAIACTPFTALCGFRPKEEINGFIKTINEISDSVEKLLGVTKLNKTGTSKVGAISKAQKAQTFF